MKWLKEEKNKEFINNINGIAVDFMKPDIAKAIIDFNKDNWI